MQPKQTLLSSKNLQNDTVLVHKNTIWAVLLFTEPKVQLEVDY